MDSNHLRSIRTVFLGLDRIGALPEFWGFMRLPFKGRSFLLRWPQISPLCWRETNTYPWESRWDPTKLAVWIYGSYHELVTSPMFQVCHISHVTSLWWSRVKQGQIYHLSFASTWLLQCSLLGRSVHDFPTKKIQWQGWLSSNAWWFVLTDLELVPPWSSIDGYYLDKLMQVLFLWGGGLSIARVNMHNRFCS